MEKQIDSVRDSVLVRRLIAGDPEALGDLYDLWGGWVYALALRLVSDPKSAADLTEATFLYVWDRIETFDPARGPLRRWMGLATIKLAIDNCARGCVAAGAAE